MGRLSSVCRHVDQSVHHTSFENKISVVSDSSHGVYPDNTISSFQIQLARSLDLTTGTWEVGLYEVTYRTTESEFSDNLHIFVYCDLIVPQLIGDSYTHCMRIVRYQDYHHVFKNVYYMPVQNTYCQSVAVEILTRLDDSAPFASGAQPRIVVLHFRKRIK